MARRSTGPTVSGSALRLGVFAVVTTLALALLTDALGGLSLPGGGAGYTALFTDATGLLPGDEVRIAGAKVGEVEDIRLKQGDPPLAEVEFSLDDDRVVPATVHATIRYRNMVGQRYIALTRAPDDTTTGTHRLEPGDVIGIPQTTPALDLTVLLNGFKPLFAALTPDQVNELSFEIIQTLQGEGSTVESLLMHTASLTSTLAEHDETIGNVITNLNAVLETVADHQDQLDTSIGRLQEFISGLSDDSDALGEAVVSIGNLTTKTGNLVAQARPSLDADVSALETLSTTLNDNSDAIVTALDRLPDTYTALLSTASYGSWFNFFLCDFDANIGITADTTINPAAIHSPMARCRADGSGS